MVGTRVDLDGADQVQRFLEAINLVSTSRSTHSSDTIQSADGFPQVDDVNGKDSPTADLKNSSDESDTMTPNVNRSRVGSESMQVTPSPHLAGLLPPQNTPQTMPHSPRHIPISDTIPEETDDTHMVFRIASGFPGKPLSESIWAPKSTLSSQKGPSSSSDGLIPTKVAEHDDTIHESYERMSFKAADPKHKGASIVGDRVPTNPITKYATSTLPADKLDPFLTAPSALRSEHYESGEQSEKTIPVEDGTSMPSQTGNQVSEPSKLRQEVSQSDGSVSDDHSPTQRQVSLPIRTKKFQLCEHAGNDKTVAGKNVPPELSRGIDDHKTSPVKSVAGQSTTVTEDPTEATTLPPHLRIRKSLEKKPKAKGSNEAPDESSDNGTNIAVSNKNQDLTTVKTALDAPLGKKSPAPSSSSDFLAQWLSTSKTPPHTLDDSRKQKENSKAAAGLVPNVEKAHEVLRSKSPNMVRKQDEGPDSSSSSIEASGPDQAKSHRTEEAENLEHKLFFKQWPKLDQRDRAAAQIRTVIITELPPSATASFISSHVFGGAIEHIHVVAPSASSSPVTASVRFLHGADCMNFYNATSNGLVYNDKSPQNAEKFAFVHLGKDVDVIGGLLGQWIQAGATRCVRAIPVDAEYGREYLWKIAERKGRKLEGIEDDCKEKTGARFVVWRFCDIKHAVEFKAALARDEEWEICNVTYADDPCARSADVHA